MCSTRTTPPSRAERRLSPTRTRRPRKASAWALGLNWYLNENLKWVLNYEQTSFDGGDPGGPIVTTRRFS